MPNYSTNLNTWGSTGQAPPANYSYEEGEQPVDAWDNFLMSNIINDIEHLIDVSNNELLARDGSVNLQADLSDDQGNTIWDYSAGNVPTASQETANITVSAGDGLKGGGSFSNQGGSTTLNIEPADFAGGGLQDDGSDNLQVDTSILYTDEEAQDAVGSALTTDFNYDDAANQIGLSFDPSTHVTTTDLNNHTANSSAHHGAPPWTHNWQTTAQPNVSFGSGGGTVIWSTTYDGGPLSDFGNVDANVTVRGDGTFDSNFGTPSLAVEITGDGGSGSTVSKNAGNLYDSSSQFTFSTLQMVTFERPIEIKITDQSSSNSATLTDVSVGVWG